MIVCTGEALIDFVPAQQSPEIDAALPVYHPVVGGSPFNCVIAVARLGAKAAFIGAVSEDFFGDEIVRRLLEDGVAETYLRRVPNPTTLAFVKRAADGSASYAFYTNDSADRALSVDALPRALPEGAILQLGSISLIPDGEGEAVAHLAEREADRRVILYDPNIRPSVIESETRYRRRVHRVLRSATILKTSNEDLGWLYPGTETDQAAAQALGAGAAAVVVTAGNRGSTVYTAADTGTHAGTGGTNASGLRPAVTVPAEQVQVVDTIGAGDSFMAALMVWLDENHVRSRSAVSNLTKEQWTSALEFATKVSGVVCTRQGADPPYRAELDAG